MQRQWTVLVDTREKAPLLFPEHLTVLDEGRLPSGKATSRVRLHVVRRKLETGDYLLGSHPSSTIVERKGRVEEVAANCLSRDRRRFVSCLERLRDACDHPILVLEGSPLSLERTKHVREPGVALDALFRLLLEYRVDLLLLPTTSVGQRRAAGAFIARLLLAGATHAARTVHAGDGVRVAPPVGVKPGRDGDLPVRDEQ